MGCWGLKQYLQVQWLGTREGSSSGQSQLCAHAQLWGLAACACGVAEASCKHTCIDEGKQQGPGPTVGTLSASGRRLGCQGKLLWLLSLN